MEQEERIISPSELPIEVYEGSIPKEFADLIKNLPADYPYFLIKYQYEGDNKYDGSKHIFTRYRMFLGELKIKSEEVITKENVEDYRYGNHKKNDLIGKLSIEYVCDYVIDDFYETASRWSRTRTYDQNKLTTDTYGSVSYDIDDLNEKQIPLKSSMIWKIEFRAEKRWSWRKEIERLSKGASIGKRIGEIIEYEKIKIENQRKAREEQEIRQNEEAELRNYIERESLILAYKVSKMFKKPIYFIQDKILKFPNALSTASDDLKEYFMENVYNSVYDDMNVYVKIYIERYYIEYVALNPSQYFNDVLAKKITSVNASDVAFENLTKNLSADTFANLDILVYEPIYKQSSRDKVFIKVGTKDSVLYITNENNQVTIRQIFVRDSLIGMLLPDILFGKFIE